MNEATKARIRRELRLAYDNGVVAGEGKWPAPSKDQVLEVGYDQIMTAILADDTLAGPEDEESDEEPHSTDL